MNGATLIARFTKFIVAQVQRSENQMADDLANLASNKLYPCHVELNIIAHPSIYNVEILTAEIQDDCSWISLISSYLRNGALPKDKSEAVKIKARAARYALISDVLYRRSFSRPYQRCVPPNEAKTYH